MKVMQSSPDQMVSNGNVTFWCGYSNKYLKTHSWILPAIFNVNFLHSLGWDERFPVIDFCNFYAASKILHWPRNLRWRKKRREGERVGIFISFLQYIILAVNWSECAHWPTDLFDILVEGNLTLFINTIPEISIKEYYLSQKSLGICRYYHCMNPIYE